MPCSRVSYKSTCTSSLTILCLEIVVTVYVNNATFIIYDSSIEVIEVGVANEFPERVVVTSLPTRKRWAYILLICWDRRWLKLEQTPVVTINDNIETSVVSTLTCSPLTTPRSSEVKISTTNIDRRYLTATISQCSSDITLSDRIGKSQHLRRRHYYPVVFRSIPNEQIVVSWIGCDIYISNITKTKDTSFLPVKRVYNPTCDR